MYKLYYTINGGEVMRKSFKTLHEAMVYTQKLKDDSFLELKFYNEEEIKKLDLKFD
jgi:hypothetical protein